MKKLTLILAIVLALLLSACAEQARDLGYDPGADPKAALASARVVAQASNKSVLVIAGGEGCRWCQGLDRLIH
jgi:thioredoxin-related protein